MTEVKESLLRLFTVKPDTTWKDFREWLDTQDPTSIKEVWEECPNGHWLEDLMEKAGVPRDIRASAEEIIARRAVANVNEVFRLAAQKTASLEEAVAEPISPLDSTDVFLSRLHSRGGPLLFSLNFVLGDYQDKSSKGSLSLWAETVASEREEILEGSGKSINEDRYNRIKKEEAERCANDYRRCISFEAVESYLDRMLKESQEETSI